MGNPVMHWEMMTRQPEKLAAFYSNIFHWDIQPDPQLHYYMANTGSKLGIKGGLLNTQGTGCPKNVKLTAYIGVEDLTPYCRKIVKAGGKIIVRKHRVPGVGSLALFKDPEGRLMGLFQPLHLKKPRKNNSSAKQAAR